MIIQSIETGYFKLDGGAMFGVIPKVLWQKLNPADERNRCTWAMRCLLVQVSNRLMLVDTGIGDKQDGKFFAHYDLHGDVSLQESLRQVGVSEEDVTDVLLTHLHFDHVGGAVQRINGELRPTFPKATYWSHSRHWQWAIEPNPRERASFLVENIQPLAESGQLRFVDQEEFNFPGMELIMVDGHTEKMILPLLQVGNRAVFYPADLIPSSAHLPLPYVMSYDIRPLVTMEEKGRLLDRAVDENWLLVFEHDPVVEAATVERTERGVRLREKGTLQEMIPRK